GGECAMKPTDRMRPAPAPDPEPAGGDVLAPLVERRQAIARALAETREAADGRLARAIDEQVRAAVAVATARPDPGAAGRLAVRGVEAEKAAEARAGELKAAVAEALAAQQKELTAALEAVDRLIAGARRPGRGSSTPSTQE